MRIPTLIVVLMLWFMYVQCQESHSCAVDECRKIFENGRYELPLIDGSTEKRYRQQIQNETRLKGAGILTIPLVIHIIHDGGTENISDTQVQAGVSHLNNAFRNLSPYNPAIGVDIELEFCLASRTPDNQPTSGIVRHQSPFTDMAVQPGHNNLVTLGWWDSREYVNVWLVKEACLLSNCNAAGYSTPAAAHGTIGEGIVIESFFWGVSPSRSSIIAHEMGHYFGLEHTFRGGCKNDNCLMDGDFVCDTPPDNFAAGVPCNAPNNSCHTDSDDTLQQNPFRDPSLGGLGDQNDLVRNFMDYSGSCREMFTEGQKQRIHYFLHEVRTSLLSSRGCMVPCTDFPTAAFSPGKDTVYIGDSLVLNNLSTGGNTHIWYKDGTQVSTEAEPTLFFTKLGECVIQLSVSNGLAECDSSNAFDTILVLCPVEAVLSYEIIGDWIKFRSQSQFADHLQWEVRNSSGDLLFSSAEIVDSFNVAGLQYIQLCLTQFVQ